MSGITAYGYTFQQVVADSGLMDYKARAYDPFLQKFIQPDTVVAEPGSSQGYNRYVYVDNCPINKNDPSGHCPICIAAAVGAIVGFSVDILIQTIPQMTNGVSPLEVNINWAEAGGAAVAGLLSGATLGVGTLVAAGATTGGTITAMALAGGVGNVLGNQAGALTSGVLENGFTQDAVITAQDEYGFGNVSKMGVDFATGAIASGVTEGITQIKLSNNVPKIISTVYSMNKNGGIDVSYKAIPDMTLLGHPSIRPNFNSPLQPVTIYTGLTTLSNYTENYFTSKVSEAILHKKGLE